MSPFFLPPYRCDPTLSPLRLYLLRSCDGMLEEEGKTTTLADGKKTEESWGKGGDKEKRKKRKT